MPPLPRTSITTRPSPVSRQTTLANAQSSTPSISRDPASVRQTQLARAHDTTVETNRQRIEREANSLAYDRDLNSFRNGIVTGLRGIDYVYKPLKYDPGVAVERGFSLFSSAVFGDADFLNVGTIVINPLARGAQSENGLIKYPSKVVTKTIEKPLKKEITALIVQQLARYPRLFRGRALANAIPLIGDHIGGALVAAQIYADGGDLAEAIVLAEGYVVISKAAGATAAAACAAVGAGAGSIVPFAGTFAGGITGATVCDAAASVAAGEVYLKLATPGIRNVQGDTQQRLASGLTGISNFAAAAVPTQTPQTNTPFTFVTRQQIASAPVVVIAARAPSPQLAANNRTAINQRLAGRRTMTQRANQVSAERTNIATEVLEGSSNAYRYNTAPPPLTTPRAGAGQLPRVRGS